MSLNSFPQKSFVMNFHKFSSFPFLGLILAHLTKSGQKFIESGPRRLRLKN
jgi:hypothetical protein